MIIFFTDYKASLKSDSDQVQNHVKKLTGVKLLPVGVGPHIDIRELEKITSKGFNVIHVGECENPDTVRERIWHGIENIFCFIIRDVNSP